MRTAIKIGAVVLVVFAACVLVGLRPASGTGPGRAELAAAASPSTTTAAGGSGATTISTGSPVEITIAAVGDVLIHKQILRAAKAAGSGGGYDFWPTFSIIAPYLSTADYTVANLETRLAGPEFGYSSYPRFNSPGELADALVASGVDLVSTANNHSLDKRWAGIVNTLDRLDEAGLSHVGTYRSAEEKAANNPLIVDIQGIRVAFINYTDYLNDFTPPREHKAYAVNFLRDPEQVAREAAAAREAGADVVIALLHWGKEYCTRPNGKQIKYAQGADDYPGLLSLGVDVILGSHPHVVEPAVCMHQETSEGTKDTYVVYSMGNFVSGQDKWRTNSGVIVYVHIERREGEVSVTGLSYMGVYVQQAGPYPRKVRVLPVLPGLDHDPDIPVNTVERKRMDQVWEYLTDMFYQPEYNIVPLDPAALVAVGG